MNREPGHGNPFRAVRMQNHDRGGIWLSRCTKILLWLATAASAALAATHYVAGFGIAWDIGANVSYFAAIPLACVGCIAALLRNRALMLVAFGVAIAALLPMLVRIQWPEPAGPAGSEASVLVCNMRGKPDAWARLRGLVDRYKPDLILLVEAEDGVVRAIVEDEAATAHYPHRVLPKPGMSWAHVMLSRHPLQPLRLQGDRKRHGYLFTYHRASFVELPQGRIILSAEHFTSPRNVWAWEDGNRRIRLTGELIREQLAPIGVPFIVGGDFNTTPTGYRDALLREGTGLHGDPLGGLLKGTWPTWAPSLFRLPLDRVWASKEIAFTSREVLADVGSDHLPVLVRFRFQE